MNASGTAAAAYFENLAALRALGERHPALRQLVELFAARRAALCGPLPGDPTEDDRLGLQAAELLRQSAFVRSLADSLGAGRA